MDFFKTTCISIIINTGGINWQKCIYLQYICLMYRIKEIVKNQGLTLRELAKKIEVAPNTLSRIINGENTTVDMLQKIASGLEVDIKDLFSGSSHTVQLILNNELKTFGSLEEFKRYVVRM